MKKIMLMLIAGLFIATSFSAVAAGGAQAGSVGSGSPPSAAGTEFQKPRAFGEEATQDEEAQAHERKFEEAAPGAWSKDPEPGKDKPSPDD